MQTSRTYPRGATPCILFLIKLRVLENNGFFSDRGVSQQVCRQLIVLFFKQSSSLPRRRIEGHTMAALPNINQQGDQGPTKGESPCTTLTLVLPAANPPFISQYAPPAPHAPLLRTACNERIESFCKPTMRGTMLPLTDDMVNLALPPFLPSQLPTPALL